ncbi:unnamed protein product, partial [Pylaiella littoralis]
GTRGGLEHSLIAGLKALGSTRRGGGGTENELLSLDVCLCLSSRGAAAAFMEFWVGSEWRKHCCCCWYFYFCATHPFWFVFWCQPCTVLIGGLVKHRATNTWQARGLKSRDLTSSAWSPTDDCKTPRMPPLLGSGDAKRPCRQRRHVVWPFF